MTNMLIIRLSSLGDVIHTFPMVRELKANFENCKITWLVDESFVDLVKLNPYVDHIITIPLRRLKHKKILFIKLLYQWYKSLYNTKFDYIIDSQGLIKSAILTKFFHGIKIGFDSTSAREYCASFFYHRLINVSTNNSAINKNRIFASKIFNYSIDLNDCDFGLSGVTEIREQSEAYIIFFHGSSKANKLYPNFLWIELAQYLIYNYGLKIYLPYGDKVELARAQYLKKNINSDKVVIPALMNYFRLCNLISGSVFVFGVDTGLVHLANALAKNMLAIYVATDPTKTGIFESSRAKNIGGINLIPPIDEVISNFEQLKCV